MENSKLSNQNEVTTLTENQNEVEAKVESESTNKSFMDQVVDVISDTVSRLVNPNQQGKVKSLVRDVLVTVYTMCAADEYALGVRVDGELYRYNDYTAPEGIGKLLIAKRVVVRDVPSAKDYLSRGKFKVSGKVLTPADFAMAIRQILSALRLNSNCTPLSRPEEALLSEAAQYVVTGGKVADRSQKTIYFISLISDDEARVPIKEWAKSIALTLFN